MKRIYTLIAFFIITVFSVLHAQAAELEVGYNFGAYSANGTSVIDLGYEFSGKVLFEYDLHIPANINSTSSAVVFGGDRLSDWASVGPALYINSDWNGSEEVFYTQDAKGNGAGNVVNSSIGWKNKDETTSKPGYTTYHVEEIIDTTAPIANGFGQYEIYMTPDGGERTQITVNGLHGFRTSYDKITKLGVWTYGAVIKISDLRATYLKGDTRQVRVNYMINGSVAESHSFLRKAGESFVCPASPKIEYGGKEYVLSSNEEERTVQKLTEDTVISLNYVPGPSHKVGSSLNINDGEATAIFNVYSENEEKLTAYIAQYTNDGDLCAVALSRAVVNGSGVVSVKLDLKEDGGLVKAMLWNGELQPIAEVTRADEKTDFVHPGLLHTKEDISRISTAVKAGEQPYLDGWNALLQHWLSKPTDISLAKESVDRTSGSGDFTLLGRDMARAYQCALRWKIEGNTECAETAVMLLNDWSAKLKNLTGNDRFLVAGIYGYQLANAAELMRDYPGFELLQMQNMLLEVFVPMCEDFLDRHNGAYITEYWANWDLCNVAALVSIGIFCDRRDIYERGIEYYRYGDGNGAIYNAIPHLFADEGLAQNQESGRDQGHNTLSIGMLGVICETAWNQGDDLYSWADNRLMYAAEYVARYNNGYDVPFELYEWGGYNGANNSQSQISSSGRGAVRPIWELLYNHYANRMGYNVPNIKEAVERNRPESGAEGNFDISGFGTLLFTRPEGSGRVAAPLGGNIKEGVYRIIVKRTQKALTSDSDGVTQKSVGEEGQEWIITDLGSGQYSIINAATGLALGTEGGSYDPKTEMTVSEYTGASWQKFTFLPADEDGYYRITPIHTSKALDVLDNSNVDGAKIIQWRYLYNSNQQWRLEPIETDAE